MHTVIKCLMVTHHTMWVSVTFCQSLWNRAWDKQQFPSLTLIRGPLDKYQVFFSWQKLTFLWLCSQLSQDLMSSSLTVEYVVINPIPGFGCDMSTSFTRHWKQNWLGLDVGHRGLGNSFNKFKTKEWVFQACKSFLCFCFLSIFFPLVILRHIHKLLSCVRVPVIHCNITSCPCMPCTDLFHQLSLANICLRRRK